ncbi:MAG: NUDIX domain-containing protein [Verrucomicrobia bacterium]|nr:NUDIX domain-containing protein [Verrucomicrobiota bacterium]
MKTSIRIGAYALMIRDGQILLTYIPHGPYQGLWHLPGGGIELTETPEEALHREVLEEAGLKIVDPVLLTTVSHYCAETKAYHYIGIVYRVDRFVPADRPPQDETRWFALDTLEDSQITPFVRQLRAQGRLEHKLLNKPLTHS